MMKAAKNTTKKKQIIILKTFLLASLIVKLKWKLGNEKENFRHTRAGWLTVGGVHIHRELQLDVLRSVERCHEEKCDALWDFLEAVRRFSCKRINESDN